MMKFLLRPTETQIAEAPLRIAYCISDAKAIQRCARYSLLINEHQFLLGRSMTAHAANGM